MGTTRRALPGEPTYFILDTRWTVYQCETWRLYLVCQAWSHFGLARIPGRAQSPGSFLAVSAIVCFLKLSLHPCRLCFSLCAEQGTTWGSPTRTRLFCLAPPSELCTTRYGAGGSASQRTILTIRRYHPWFSSFLSRVLAEGGRPNYAHVAYDYEDSKRYN